MPVVAVMIKAPSTSRSVLASMNRSPADGVEETRSTPLVSTKVILLNASDPPVPAFIVTDEANSLFWSRIIFLLVVAVMKVAAPVIVRSPL